MEPALEIMAGVGPTFKASPFYVLWLLCTNWLTSGFGLDISVAYKRFADNILDATSICQKLTGEFRTVARDRADLLKKMERLESASKELQYFGV